MKKIANILRLKLLESVDGETHFLFSVSNAYRNVFKYIYLIPVRTGA